MSASGQEGDRGGGVSVPLSAVGRSEPGPRSAVGSGGLARHLPAVPGSRPRERPSASPPPPALHVAPRLLLRGRRRPEPGRAETGFPPLPRAGWPAGQGSTGSPSRAQLRSGVRGGSGGSLTSLPGVLSASSFPRVRSAASAAAATASPTSPASRGAAAAAPPPRSDHCPWRFCSLLHCFSSPRRPGPAGSGETVPEAAARPPQPPAHNPPRGSAGAGGPRPGPGGAPQPRRGALARAGAPAEGAAAFPRGGEYPARLPYASSNSPSRKDKNLR